MFAVHPIYHDYIYDILGLCAVLEMHILCRFWSANTLQMNRVPYCVIYMYAAYSKRALQRYHFLDCINPLLRNSNIYITAGACKYCLFLPATDWNHLAFSNFLSTHIIMSALNNTCSEQPALYMLDRAKCIIYF